MEKLWKNNGEANKKIFEKRVDFCFCSSWTVEKQLKTMEKQWKKMERGLKKIFEKKSTATNEEKTRENIA